MRPPRKALMPVLLTAPVASELLMVAPASLFATSPPTAKAFVPVTAPVACAFLMLPALSPASPPTKETAPPPTTPDALESAIDPGPVAGTAAISAWQNASLHPEARPPGRMGAVTGPEFEPTRPPTLLPSPPVTAPVADELVIVPAGKLVKPGIVTPLKSPTSLTLAPASPPTALEPPALTSPAACDWSILPALAPTRPPMTFEDPLPVTLAVLSVCDPVTSPRLLPT